MKKDVIYIDIEDDITSIIGKVKDAGAPIVALVPPKRIGVLQSVVNLKLLQRAASSVDKRVVLITADLALTSLAAGVKIPVAKTLQSKPELAHIDALEIDDEDIIDGRDMPAVEGTHIDLEESHDDAPKAVGAGLASAAVTSGVQATQPIKPLAAKNTLIDKGSKKIPDFMRFKKRAFIIGGALVALILIGWWAFFIAPSAKVTITANTVLQNINETASLDPSATTNASQGILKVSYQQVKKSASVDFAATGKKDIGEKASGQVTFRNCESPAAQTVEAGTTLSVNGLNYATQASVSVPAGSGGFGGCSSPGVSAPVGIVAADIGETYNAASGTTFSVAGHTPSAGVYFRAVASTAIAGGSKQTVNVVSQEDVEKAKTQLAAQDQNAVKTDLTKQFGTGYHIISESFKAEPGNPVASPVVGEQSTQAKLSAETNYTLAGIADSDLKTMLEAYAQKAIKESSKQTVFDNGLDAVSLTKFQYQEGGKASVGITTSAYLGPKIDKEDLKKQLAGKRYGEIQQIVQEIPNVDKVEINFSPFWVTNAPGANKINIEFSVKQK